MVILDQHPQKQLASIVGPREENFKYAEGTIKEQNYDFGNGKLPHQTILN
jgi:hypothetical protein